VRFVRSQWRGRLVIKGLLHPGDVAIAREVGADGVILSNHGGRQLDGGVSPMRALPAAIQKAGDMAVMIDKGFRRGTDILKAVGLGAHCVFIGRPFNYASALAGEVGVNHAIGLLRTQLRADLGMLGLRSLKEMNRDVLFLDNSKPSVCSKHKFAGGGTVLGPETLGVGGGTAARHEAGEGGRRPQAGGHSDSS
jgi:L-lactate dehydrogenase (cytochrome)